MQRSSPVVFNLIVINVILYLAQVLFDGEESRITAKLALWHYDSPFFSPYQLVSYMFVHDPGNFFHILFNMFMLFVLGPTLERVWGSKRFLIFYLICGIGAGVAQMFLSEGISVGASGALMGLMGAFAYLFPNTQFYIIPFPFPIKAKYLVIIYAAIDLFGQFRPGRPDNIGHFAHLGGLIIGLIIVIIWNKTNKRTFY